MLVSWLYASNHLEYSGAGKVPPAPFNGTTGTEGVGVVVAVLVVEEVAVGVVFDGAVVCGAVVAGVVVDVDGWEFVVVVDIRVVVVVLLLQAPKIEDAANSKDIITTSHFLPSLLNNLRFSFIFFLSL